jgi:hypothetical protein
LPAHNQAEDESSMRIYILCDTDQMLFSSFLIFVDASVFLVWYSSDAFHKQRMYVMGYVRLV